MKITDARADFMALTREHVAHEENRLAFRVAFSRSGGMTPEEQQRIERETAASYLVVRRLLMGGFR